MRSSFSRQTEKPAKRTDIGKSGKFLQAILTPNWKTS